MFASITGAAPSSFLADRANKLSLSSQTRPSTSGSGRIRADGAERDITFTSTSSDVQEAIDAAYHAKYDRYGPRIVGSVVGLDTHSVTIRLEPRTSQEQR